MCKVLNVSPSHITLEHSLWEGPLEVGQVGKRYKVKETVDRRLMTNKMPMEYISRHGLKKYMLPLPPRG